MSYKDAKTLVKANNISNKAQLDKFISSDLKPENFPDLPNMVYQRKGWVSFDQFLK